MEKKQLIKCPKCGFNNIIGTRKCSKCKTHIDDNRKVCPKCGKVNFAKVKKCTTCKFDFTKKRRTVWANLVISLLIIIILSLLVFFGKEGIVEKFSFGLRVIAGFGIFVLFVQKFTFGSEDTINYSAEEEMFDDRKGFAIMKRWSNRAIFIGAILVFLFLVYYYFIR